MKNDEGPVRAALALEQPLEDGQRLVVTPVGDGGPVVPADHQVRTLALPDLVGDHGLDELGVLVVVDVEPAAVGEGHVDVVDRLHDLGDRELALALDVHDDQRRPVVVRLEPALLDLTEGDGEQPVGDVVVLGTALLERDVQDRLDDAAPAADQPDRVPVPRPRRPPDDRPRLVPPQRLDGFPGTRLADLRHATDPTSAAPSPSSRVQGRRRGSPVRMGSVNSDAPGRPPTRTGLPRRRGAHTVVHRRCIRARPVPRAPDRRQAPGSPACGTTRRTWLTDGIPGATGRRGLAGTLFAIAPTGV